MDYVKVGTPMTWDDAVFPKEVTRIDPISHKPISYDFSRPRPSRFVASWADDDKPNTLLKVRKLSPWHGSVPTRVALDQDSFERKMSIFRAYSRGGVTYTEIGKTLGITPGRVSQLAKAGERIVSNKCLSPVEKYFAETMVSDSPSGKHFGRWLPQMAAFLQCAASLDAISR